MRGRSYSYSPSPPRSYGRRYRSPSPRGRYSRGKEPPTSLLVRNLRHDCRPEDLRGTFGRYGPIKDIYLPRDYYTGEPRGFGFVQFLDPADAADAKYDMDGYVLLGRELTVVFAEENRKKPSEMRARERAVPLTAGAHLPVILGLHDMQELIHVALMITPQGGGIQGLFHLGADHTRDALTDLVLTQDLLIAQEAGVEALMAAAAVAPAVASPLDTLGDMITSLVNCRRLDFMDLVKFSSMV
ncbi:Serine/arginine-rich SC35-like splicing factor SCL30A [Bienertia sinuspersici]